MSEGRSDRLPAVRHVVYRDLLSWLPPASIHQTVSFIANLALCRGKYRLSDPIEKRTAAEREIMKRFILLRVSPDISTTNYRAATLRTIEDHLARKYGDDLSDIAGFYHLDRWRLNLPEGCA